MSAKILPLPTTARKPTLIRLDSLASERGVLFMEMQISRWLKANPHSNITALARQCNLSNRTVENIHMHRTREPRLTTMILLLIGLGFVGARFE